MRAVVIPALNEEGVIGDVVRKTRQHASLVVVVDDGSSDATAKRAQEAGAHVVRHIINRGVGAAWVTGFQYALKYDVQVVVVLDADGQHDPEDIRRLAEVIEQGKADVVIGARNFSRNMPVRRRFLNTLANMTTQLLFGIGARDSQSGFRALSRDAVSRMRLQTNHFEVCSEMFGEIKRLGLRLKEVSIESIYTDYSLSKGQSALEGLRTLRALLYHKFFKS